MLFCRLVLVVVLSSGEGVVWLISEVVGAEEVEADLALMSGFDLEEMEVCLDMEERSSWSSERRF